MFMGKEDIDQLNRLKSKPQQQLRKLVEFYLAEKITLDDLIKSKKLEIVPSTLNQFAIKLENGSDGLKRNIKAAQQLYVRAGELGEPWGWYNAGINHLGYVKSIETDFKTGCDLMERAKVRLQTDIGFEGDYLIAEAYDKKGDSVNAARHYRMVSKVNKKTHQLAQAGLKRLLAEHLNEIYYPLNPKMDIDEDDQKAKEKTAKKPESGFVRLSDTLDGYAPNAAAYSLIKLNFSSIECETAEQAVASADHHLKDAEMKDLPETTVKALKKRKATLEVEAKKARKNYKKVKLSHEQAAEEKEFKRQIQTEKHFFSASRALSNKSRAKAYALQANRLTSDSKEVKMISVTNVPVRRMITAELAVMQASLDLFGQPQKAYDTDFGWFVTGKDPYSPYLVEYGNKEKLKLGSTEITYKQRTNPHYNHKGDYFMDNLGDYSKIGSVIDEITQGNKTKEKRLATFMLRYSKTGQAIALDELQSLNADAKENDKDQINTILYHIFVKEPVRWMQPHDPTHEIPWATAQSRAVRLIEAGHLKMVDVFSQFAPYGVFTDKNIGKDENIAKVKEKVRNITLLYQELILKPSVLRSAKYVRFFKDHNNGELLSTRGRLHNELEETYGGASDTDGEGYDSETAECLYPSTEFTHR